MILLLFDAHKLDISDEFQAAIKCVKGQDDKIRVVLNKADKVTSQQLMRVYGASECARALTPCSTRGGGGRAAPAALLSRPPRTLRPQ